MPDYEREAAIDGPVAGVDDVGRGPWAGPVIAAAAILSPDAAATPALAALNDSKALARPQRERCFAALMLAQQAGIVWLATGHADVAEIDRLNVHEASMLAMRRAVAALPTPPAFALVDGNRLPDLSCPAEAVVKGDSQVLSIAAASIVAKVFRDAVMIELARHHPGYGWERNAGYGTAEHRQALAELGACELHRKSFAPIRKLLSAHTKC